MALSINLLHEQKQELIERRQDPIKLGLWVGALLVVVLMAYYLFRQQQLAGVRRDLAGLQAKWAQREPALASAVKEERELRLKIDSANHLLDEAKRRILWGPILQSLLETTPREVQLHSLDGKAEPENGALRLSVGGIGAGADPRGVAEGYRKMLADRFAAQFPGAVVEFRSLDEEEEPVLLDNRRLASVRFVIELAVKKP